MNEVGPPTAMEVGRKIRRFLSSEDRRALRSAVFWAVAAALASAGVATITVPVTQCLQGSCPGVLSGLSEQQGLWGAVGVAASVVILRLAVLARASWTLTLFQQGAQQRTISRLLDTYLHMTWRDFSSRNQAHYVQRALTTSVDAAFGAQQWVTFIGSGATVLLLALVLALSAPWFLLLALLGGVAVSAALSGLLNRQVHAAAAQREEAVRGSTLTLTEALGSFKEIRAYRREDLFLDRAGGQLAEVARTNTRLTFLPDLPRLTFDALGLVVVLSLAAAWVALGRDLSTLVPQLVLFAVVARTFQPALVALMASRATLTGSLINLELVQTEFELAKSRQPVLEPVVDRGPAAWRLEGVHFRHSDEAPWILSGADLAVPHPSWTALVGASGSGKTTVIELLCGFRAPDDGWAGFTWHSDVPPVICYVPQHVALLDGTVAENVAFDAEQLEPSRLARALAVADLVEVVGALPDGASTRVGPNGTALSGGQRQRLAIARALYRAPDFLLLDEATSGLDEATEHRVLDNIQREFPTTSVLLVTHRGSSLSMVRSVLTLEGGRLVRHPSGAPPTRAEHS